MSNKVYSFNKFGKNFQAVTLIFFNTLFFLWLLYVLFTNYQVFQKFSHNTMLARDLSDQVVYLDEVLTMSAIAMVTTQDPHWLARYKKYEPILDKVITELSSLPKQTPTERSDKEYLQNYLSETEEANNNLVKLEQESFRLVKMGKKEEAIALLRSPLYKKLKDIYSQGIRAYVKKIQTYHRENLTKYKSLTIKLLLIVFSYFVISLTFILLMYRYYSIRKHKEISQEQAQAQMEKSLQEKEVLLKEIHHRVKNNLQIICSLLSIQAHNIKDPKIRQPLEESRERIVSMSLIHEQLYQSDNFALIRFKDYVEELSQNLVSCYAQNDIDIQFSVNSQESLSLEKAIPCGILIYEIITNSLKYAFPQQKGKIQIEAKSKENHFYLTISDDGQGMKESQTAGFGWKLINILVGQLKGEITTHCDQGTRVEIIFPLLQTRTV